MAKEKQKTNKVNSNNLGFEEKLWKAANTLRGQGSTLTAKYADILLGLIFLKYASLVFEKRYQELVAEGQGLENDVDEYKRISAFFMSRDYIWSEIVKRSRDANIAAFLDEAMENIEHHNPKLENTLPKKYVSSELNPTALGDIIDIFTNEIHFDEVEKSRDILGRAYEYCLSHFAESGGGEFYTPKSIVDTIVAILDPVAKSRIYDPACGSGGMFVQSIKYLEEQHEKTTQISFWGQESEPDTWRIAKINMAIRGIEANFGPEPASTFTNDHFKDEKFDFIFANPPFNQKEWWNESLSDDPRWQYGIPSKTNANFAWMQHMISHLSPRGKIALVLSNNSTSSTDKTEAGIRQKIIEDNILEAIVSFPTQLFYNVSLPVVVWVFNKKKKNKDKFLFINATKLGHMVSTKHRELSKDDINKIVSTYKKYTNGELENEKGFSAVVSLNEIKENNYNLTTGRYVEVNFDSEPAEEFASKMKNLSSELIQLFQDSKMYSEEIVNNLANLGFGLEEENEE